MKTYLNLLVLFVFISCQKQNLENYKENVAIETRNINESQLKAITDTFCNEFLFALDENFDAISYYPGMASFNLTTFINELETNDIITEVRFSHICSEIRNRIIAVNNDSLAEEILLNQIILNFISIENEKISSETSLLAVGEIETRSYPCTEEFQGTMNAAIAVFVVCAVLSAETGAGPIGCAVGLAGAYYSADKSFCTCLQTTYGHGCP